MISRESRSRAPHQRQQSGFSGNLHLHTTQQARRPSLGHYSGLNSQMTWSFLFLHPQGYEMKRLPAICDASSWIVWLTLLNTSWSLPRLYFWLLRRSRPTISAEIYQTNLESAIGRVTTMCMTAQIHEYLKIVFKIMQIHEYLKIVFKIIRQLNEKGPYYFSQHICMSSDGKQTLYNTTLEPSHAHVDRQRDPIFPAEIVKEIQLHKYH